MSAGLSDQPANRWLQKQLLITKLRGFVVQSSRNNAPCRALLLTPEEGVFADTKRYDISPTRAKNILSNVRFTYNPIRWYELEWADNKLPPVLLITNFYLQPLVITETRLKFDSEFTDPRLYGYAAREIKIIADKMMTP